MRTTRHRVHIHGVDVFDPSSGEVRSDSADGIAVWFIDTDYNGESFFVRHACFLGADDPYKSLRTSLKAEIDEDVRSTLNSSVPRLFAKPASERIAVKGIAVEKRDASVFMRIIVYNVHENSEDGIC